MYLVVRFDGDPTFWSLNPGLDSQPMADQLATSTDPISVPVTEPLAGTMLISPRCAGSVAILDQMPIESWIPSGVKAPSSVLYVPTPGGPTPEFPGYSLPEGTNLGELSQEIQTAMKTGGATTTPISTSKGGGKLRIDGNALAFVVLCPPSVPGPEHQ
ncbi:MAG TPA: hypothetical protein VGM14_08600 [Streptosporangiaceae bacterium]|jgi:hypothetical protein